jgi:8-oxo-dGTP pyrophosphatase MutT (NUDIX family)
MSRQHALLDQLRNYQPTDPVESEYRHRMIDLLTYAPTAFSRAAFMPGHFTAGCFIVDDAGRLLLHHHRRLNLWLHMGGHVEEDESAQEAALREAVEESGLTGLEIVGDTIFDLDIHEIPAGRGEPLHDHFDVRYLARAADPGAIRIDREESNDLAWIELDRAAELMPADAKRVIGKIERALRERSVL